MQRGAAAQAPTEQAACRDTGYRVRVLTKERYTVGDMDAARREWAVDKNTVILVFDPSAPNIFGYGARPPATQRGGGRYAAAALHIVAWKDRVAQRLHH